MGTNEKKDKIEEGIKKYLRIADLYKTTNFDVNSDFAKEFDAFYRVRRDIQWREKFFRVFAEMKKDGEKACFSTILSKMYDFTRYVEASFSSKMLHTINPEMPIWDSIVLSKLLKHLNVTVLPYQKNRPFKETLDNRVQVYNSIIEWYQKSKEATAYESQFDKNYPEYKNKIQRTKKIDFMLWGTRSDWDIVFENYEAIYQDIFENHFYPSQGSTGFQERNLTVNFSKAYEKAYEHDTVFSWFEFQFDKKKHFDCLIVNLSRGELFFVEAKRFSSTTKKCNAVADDIDRIVEFAHSKLKTDDRFTKISHFKVYGVILADVWRETKGKESIYTSFSEEKLLNDIPSISDSSKLYRVIDFSIDNCKHPYALLSFLWEI